MRQASGPLLTTSGPASADARNRFSSSTTWEVFARPGSAFTDDQRLRQPPDRLVVDLWQAEVQGEPCGVPFQDPWSLNVFI